MKSSMKTMKKQQQEQKYMYYSHGEGEKNTMNGKQQVHHYNNKVTFHDPIVAERHDYDDGMSSSCTSDERKELLWVPVDKMNESSRKDISETIGQMLSVNDDGSIECAADDDEYSLRGLEQYYIESDEDTPAPTETVQKILELQTNLLNARQAANESNVVDNDDVDVDFFWKEMRQHSLSCTQRDVDRAKELAVQDANDACMIHEENKDAIASITLEYYRQKVLAAEQRIQSMRLNNEALKNKIKSQRKVLEKQRQRSLKIKHRSMRQKRALFNNNNNAEQDARNNSHNSKQKIQLARIELQKKEIVRLIKGNRRLQHSTKALLLVNHSNMKESKMIMKNNNVEIASYNNGNESSPALALAA